VPGWRASKHVHHVVTSIIAPFGEPIDARPPVPTQEERIAERVLRKEVKDARRAAKKLEEREAKASLKGGLGSEETLGGESVSASRQRMEENEDGLGDDEKEVWDTLQQRVAEEVEAEKVKEEKKSWWR